MTDLHDRWSRPPRPGMGERIGGAVRHEGPLKPRIQAAIKRLRMQIKKLDTMLAHLQERDAKLFGRIVEATQKHDAHAGRVLGSELAEMRKVIKILGSARIALEQIELRLVTTSDLGDTVVTIMPMMGLMKSLKYSLGRVMPGAEQEIGQMAEMLGGFMTESFSDDGAFGMDDVTTAESEAILKEAAAVAESSTGEMFPSVPADAQGTQTARQF